jgi:predicted O-methyltransferase YrrM
LSHLLARLRSFFTLGLSGDLTEIGARLTKIEDDIATLRTIVRTRDERAQKKLKAGLASLVNVISILPELNIKGAVPPFPHQGFEITGEEAAFLFHLVRRHRPKLILELGSGSSTVLFAAALRANGAGRVISIEHDALHAEHTAELLEQADLSDRVELVHAPLAELQMSGRTFQWYDLGRRLDMLTEKIDLVFVDGPPGKVQSLSRYPALPVLLPHLSPRARVFVDDGAREDETRMVAMWAEMDAVAFETEALDFLPHAPVLLTMATTESRIAALRRAREERADQVGEEVEIFGQGRRSGTS